MDSTARNLIAAGNVDIGLLMLQAKKAAHVEQAQAAQASPPPAGVPPQFQAVSQARVVRASNGMYYTFAVPGMPSPFASPNGAPGGVLSQRCPGGLIYGPHGTVECASLTGGPSPSPSPMGSTKGSILGAPAQPAPAYLQYFPLASQNGGGQVQPASGPRTYFTLL